MNSTNQIDKFPGYNIAELNIGKLKLPLEHPTNKDFADALDRVNKIGDNSPGFIWRLQDNTGYGATKIKAYDDPRIIVNLTVWKSISELYKFTYSGEHAKMFKRRKEWFEQNSKPKTVLWWTKEGQLPDIIEAKNKMEYLIKNDPSSKAFTFTKRFPPHS